MAQLEKGQKLPNFTYDTPFKKGLSLSENLATEGKTALIFLRYYGCTLCQLDISELSDEYANITEGGSKLFVVLQSDPQKLSEQLKPGDLPYDIICDPEQTLYKQFEIPVAKNMAKLADVATLAKVAKATAGGFKHGDYEGEELQLPAVFIVTSDLTLDYVHYGKSAGDVPDPSKLKKLLA